MKVLYYPLFLLLMVSVMACSSSKSTTTSTNTDEIDQQLVEQKKKEKRSRISNEVLTLEDYLRRIPGLMVSSGGVRVRGGSSSLQNNQPLFIVDGVRMGHSLDRVSQMINVAEIDDLSVLKDVSETSFYGASGSNGVIVITMKKN